MLYSDNQYTQKYLSEIRQLVIARPKEIIFCSRRSISIPSTLQEDIHDNRHEKKHENKM